MRSLFLLALVFGAAACAAAPPTPSPSPEPQKPAPPPPTKPEKAENTEAPAKSSPSPKLELPEKLPSIIEEARDDTARVFACIEYNHINLMTTTPLKDREAILGRLAELHTAQPLCDKLIRQTFKGFGPFVDSFAREWSFYLLYFALTLDTSAVHNLPQFCERFGQTVKASEAALHQMRRYHQWLSREITTAQKRDPYLDTMLTRATEKVSGMTLVTSRLKQQHRQECP